MRRYRFTHSSTDGLRPAARAALLGLLAAALLLAMGAAPATAPAQSPLTTLFTSMAGSSTVSGVNSVPVGPTDLGTYRAAMAFKPTVSGKAQLLSIRGRCVIAGVNGTACADMGRVSIQSDTGGKPSGQDLGSMGFYLLEGADDDLWQVEVNGNPTGGTFRLHYTEGAFTQTTVPIPFNALHDAPAFSHLQHCRVPELPCGPVMSFLMRGFGMNSQGHPVFSTTGRFPGAIAYFTIERPGTISVTDVQLTGGTNPSVTVTQPHIQEECGTLSPAPQLTAGRKYWAVMTAEHEVGWNNWSNDTADVLESVDNGAWTTAFNTKTPALRIDSGVDACVPVAEPNPAPGTQAGPGAFRFNTIAITNKGVSPLTLGGAAFTGPDKARFSLLNGEPGPLARPYPFPRVLGVETVSILYVACSATTEGLYRATLTIDTSDPALPQITYPVECLIDKTPPTVGFSPGVPDGLDGWWKTSPILLGVTGTDPQPGSYVTRLDCSDSNADAAWSPRAVWASAMSSSITGEGAHTASCKATDLAGNQSSVFTTGFKIDSRPPLAVADVFPRPNDDGWNSSATTVWFGCDDPVPGSGLDEPASGEGSVETETAGTDVTSAGCTDVAGNTAAPVTVPVRIDWTAPAYQGVEMNPEPNAAGWNNSDVTVSFLCSDQGEVQSGVKVGWPDVVVTGETPGRDVTPSGLCTDVAGNMVRLDDLQLRVKLDRTGPKLRIEAGPRVVTNDDDAVFKLLAEDALSGVAGLRCWLDADSFEPCADGKTYTDLSDGTHRLAVQPRDVAGNVGLPRMWEWTVDTVAPETRLDSRPDPVTPSTSAAFSYGGDALGGSPVDDFECSLDDAAFGACPAGRISYSDLGAGEHSFRVRAVDEAGNADTTPESHIWTIDLAAPSTRIIAGPPARTIETVASFEFVAVDHGGSTVAGIECRLNDAPFAPCTSPIAFSGLLPGRHTFEVRAADAFGNVESPAVSHSWLVSAVVAVDDSAGTLEDVPVSIGVGTNDLRPSGQDVSVTPTQPKSARGGTVSADGAGSLRYVPPADFDGTDTFTYTASAGGETSEPATVTVSVTAVNDASAFSPGGEVSVNEDSGAYSASWASAVSAGPANEAGQHLRFVLVGDSALFSMAPAISPDGQLTFVPAPNANGRATIDVALVDDGGIANGGSDISRATLTITIRPIEDAPTVSVARAFECGGASGRLNILVHDVDTRDSALTVSASASAAQIGVAAVGAGSNRSINLTNLRRRMRATLTVGVSDGALSASTSIALVVGTNRGDTITGSDGPDVLFGRGGRDTLQGAGGNDMVCGGTGRDQINGGAGDDVMVGGAGKDVLRGGYGNDVLRGGIGNDRLFGGPGDDILRGGPGADAFSAAPGADRLVDFSARRGDRR